MDSLNTILGHRDFSEPAETRQIKKYIATHFQSDVTISYQGESIIITTGSASLANTLRFHAAEMREIAQTNKSLVIRIGSTT